MSFIQFESAREKDKARQQLREARDEMLEQAKRNAEHRAEREAQKELRGERNWMLPSVAKKFEKTSKKLKKSIKVSKKKDKKPSAKKSKKTKKKRKRLNTSSSNSSDADTDSDSDSSGSVTSSTEEDTKMRKKSKRSKNKHRKKKKPATSSSDTESDSSEEVDEWKSKNNDNNDEWIERPTTTQPANIKRDNWMTDSSSLMLKTFSRERNEKKPNIEQQQPYEKYDPAKSSRELNPYWKTTGTGLPTFQKPKIDSDDEADRMPRNAYANSNNQGSRNWQKKTASTNEIPKTKPAHERRSPTPQTESSESASQESEDDDPVEKKKETTEISKFLTDQQMNELSAKILKAEIMGNTQLIAELKQKLEDARNVRTDFIAKKKFVQKEQINAKNTEVKSNKKKNDQEHILLTRTDEQGNCRPLAQAKRDIDPRDLYGGRKGQRSKQKSKRLDTHVDGERVRYFADDDKYDIKQMFEREKYASAAESNLQFANIASKHKNPNDDLDDIFADKVRRNISETDTDNREVQRAINEHKRLNEQLENCDKCFDSIKMDKQLLVSMGDKVYLTLPWHIGLQPGHCIIIPTQHVSCCTQLDEDTWTEINDFRKALTRMFAAQHKDLIFFEIANKLHRRPHLSIHCIPISEQKGEMAPFYFKKAIEESEHEWSVNKQLISLTKKSLRNSVPKGLPYFWVNFGMASGFAHVIEDQERFPSNFALEIIGGMLNLDANAWRRPKKEQNIITKVKIFADWWKKYDCTVQH